MAWPSTRHASRSAWPPRGVSLTLWFVPPAGELPGVTVAVHYELYDGIPLLAKWITIHNRGTRSLRLNSFKSEILRVVETESQVDPSPEWQRPRLTVLTDFAFGGMSVASLHRAVFWTDDPAYTTQVNYALKTPCLLEVKPPLGPDVDIVAGAEFTGIRTFELVHDTDDRERQGLALRRMYRTIAPWVDGEPDHAAPDVDRPAGRADRHRPVRRDGLRDGHSELRQRPEHGGRVARRTSPGSRRSPITPPARASSSAATRCSPAAASATTTTSSIRGRARPAAPSSATRPA